MAEPQPPAGYTIEDQATPPAGYTLEPSLANPAPIGARYDPEAIRKLDIGPGIPLYTTSPGAPQKELPPLTWSEALITNPAKQAASGITSASAGTNKVAANVFHLLDTTASQISAFTGLPKGGVFQHIEEWLREQQKAQEQSAADLSGGQQDLASQLYRVGASAAASLPTYGVAAELAGPIAGMAGLGALENADQGGKAMLEGALQNAAAGGALTFMGPASRPIRIAGATAMTYAQLRLQGVDHETALANALTMGGMSGMHGGGATLKEMAANAPGINIPPPFRNLKEMAANAPGINIPPPFRNPNPTQLEAMQWLRDQGVHVPAPAMSGSRFLGGLQRVAESTPIGAVIGERGRQETAEGVRALSRRLEAEATPETSPQEFYQRFYDAENAPESKESVPTGRTDNAGKPVFEEMQMPVPVGMLKPALRPLFEQMQWMPMADRNASAGYQAIKKILEGPEFIPASQAETGLSGIKKMIREGDGRSQAIAKKIAPDLQGMIDRTVQRIGGDDAVEALQSGRKASAQQAGADWLKEGFDKARAEGEFNRQDFLWNRWQNLPEEAKRTMFSPQQAAALNRFFLGAKNLFRNVNPSGTAQVSAIGHLLAFTAHPVAVGSEVIGGGLVAKLLHSDGGIRLLTEGLRVGADTPRGKEIERQIRKIEGEEPPEPPAGPSAPAGPGRRVGSRQELVNRPRHAARKQFENVRPPGNAVDRGPAQGRRSNADNGATGRSPTGVP